MALNANKVPSSGSKQPLLEVGTYVARLVQVVGLGLQPQPDFKGKKKNPVHKIILTYELGTEFMLDENGEELKDKPRWISETMPLYPLFAEKAKSTARYKALDPKGDAGGDFGVLVNTPCNLTIVHNKSQDGRVFANIGAVQPPMKGIAVPALVNEPRVFDPDSPDMEVWEKLPDWLQERIKENLEYPGSILAEKLGSGPAKAQEHGDVSEEEQAIDDMDDIPF